MIPENHQYSHIDRAAARNADESWFLRLPPEIRTKVYFYLIPTKIHVSITQNEHLSRQRFDKNISLLTNSDATAPQCAVAREIFAWIHFGYRLNPCTKPGCNHRSEPMVRPLMRTSRAILSDLAQAVFYFTFDSFLFDMPRACKIAHSVPVLGTFIEFIRIQRKCLNLGRGKHVRRLIEVVKAFPNLTWLQVGVYQATTVWEDYYEIVTLNKILGNSGKLTDAYRLHKSSTGRASTIVLMGAKKVPAEGKLGTKIDLGEALKKRHDRLALYMVPGGSVAPVDRSLSQFPH